jgi:hypothetical protein
MRRAVGHPALIVFVILLLVYGLSAAKTITGFGDSDELIAAGYNLALPHQPGYPLITGLIFLATHLPIAEPAILAHQLAALIMAATVAVSVWVFYGLNKKKNPVLAVAFGLIAGSSGLVWRHGAHIEVFGLMSLFSVILLWWIMFFRKHWLWWGVVAGLGLGHHQLLILTVVPQLVWIIREDTKRILPLVKGVVVGLGLTLLGIWVLGQRNHPDSWRFENSIEGTVRYFLRSNYSGHSIEAGGELSAYLSRVELKSIIDSLGYYAQAMWGYWGWWNLLVVAGLVAGRKMQRSFWLILACFVLSGPVLAGYIAVTDGVIVERMYVLSQIYWGLLIGFGLLWTKKQWIWLVIAIVCMWSVFPERSLAEYRQAEQYIESVFSRLPQGAVLLCLSDISCFGTYYYQSVLGERTDVLVMPNADQFRFGRKTAWAFGGFDYPDNPFRLGEAVGRATLERTPVYAAQLSEVWVTELGLDGRAFSARQAVDNVWIIERPAETISVDCGNDPYCQLRSLSFEVWRNPNSIEPRLRLADGFDRYGLGELADRERRHAELIGAGFFQFPDRNPR